MNDYRIVTNGLSYKPQVRVKSFFSFLFKDGKYVWKCLPSYYNGEYIGDVETISKRLALDEIEDHKKYCSAIKNGFKEC